MNRDRDLTHWRCKHCGDYVPNDVNCERPECLAWRASERERYAAEERGGVLTAPQSEKE